jgi:hypothetical protein
MPHNVYVYAVRRIGELGNAAQRNVTDTSLSRVREQNQESNFDNQSYTPPLHKHFVGGSFDESQSLF